MKSLQNVTVENIVGLRAAYAPTGEEQVLCLPCLTVGQVVHGSLQVEIDNGAPITVPEMAAFVLPAWRTVRLRHLPGEDGLFKAHWAYMDVKADGAPLCDVLTLPTLLSRAASGQNYAGVRAICEETVLCRRYIAAYRMLEVVLAQATAHAPEEPNRAAIRRFVRENLASRIGAEEIAAAIGCSAPQVFRYTARYFGLSPANYVNSVRLSLAAWELERTETPVRRIALSLGFEDMPYFTRLFKKAFLLPPGEYRARRAAQDGGRV